MHTCNLISASCGCRDDASLAVIEGWYFLDLPPNQVLQCSVRHLMITTTSTRDGSARPFMFILKLGRLLHALDNFQVKHKWGKAFYTQLTLSQQACQARKKSEARISYYSSYNSSIHPVGRASVPSYMGMRERVYILLAYILQQKQAWIYM